MTAAIRVVLVDDHPLVRAGIRRVLETAPGLLVVGEAADGAHALHLVETLTPDIVVLDLAMPGVDGLEVLDRLRRRGDGLRILVLTMHAGSEYVRRAIDAGADGYLLKESAVQELLVAIDTVRSGRPYYSPRVVAELAGSSGEAGETGGADKLTVREREVLRDIARGLSTKEIAGKLAISPRTVETHRANLTRKLELRSIAQLTQFAIRAGLIDGP